MLEKGIFKLGIKVPQITLQLEPYSDRGKNHAVKEPLKQVPDDKELKTDVIIVIEKYLNRVE